jgi:hypothetical protein
MWILTTATYDTYTPHMKREEDGIILFPLPLLSPLFVAIIKKVTQTCSASGREDEVSVFPLIFNVLEHPPSNGQTCRDLQHRKSSMLQSFRSA